MCVCVRAQNRLLLGNQSIIDAIAKTFSKEGSLQQCLVLTKQHSKPPLHNHRIALAAIRNEEVSTVLG